MVMIQYILILVAEREATILFYIRGLGFKFVDFLYKSSDVCHAEIKMISSENIFFYLSYKLLSIALLIIVSTQQ